MNFDVQHIRAVEFREHQVLDFAQVEPERFDITAKDLGISSSFIKKGQFSIDAYCLALLYKVCTLCQSELSDFIDYQCSKLNLPLNWLNSLEQLIEENCERFESSKVKFRIHKLIVCIHDKRNELNPKKSRIKSNLIDFDLLDNCDEQKVKFDFRLVKFDLERLATFEEKKAYLIELKAEYQQRESYLLPNNGKPLDALIDIEMDKLDRLESIKKNSPVKNPRVKSGNNKIKINGNLNVLVDVFYQMLYELKSDSTTYLSCTPTELAEHIVNNFIDKDGNEISISTVRTILSPGKSDKRPSVDKKLKIINLLFFIFNSFLLNSLLDFQNIEIFGFS